MLKEFLGKLMIGNSGKAPFHLDRYEQRQRDPNDPWFNDSYYFTGHDSAGNWVNTRLAFRNDETEVWLDINLVGLGRLSIAEPCKNAGKIDCGTLSYSCTTIGKLWHIGFDDMMLHHDSKKKVFVMIDLTFEGTMPVFDFKKHGDPSMIARALARETWTREWFKSLGDLRQIHYEQGGVITGTVTVEGKKYSLNLNAMRDHSFGSRKWGAMKKHLWVAGLMDDGAFLNISIVEYSFIRELQAGYIYRDGTTYPLIEASGFNVLPQDDPFPRHYTLSFTAKGCAAEQVQVMVVDHVLYPMGGVYSIYEGIGRFSMNGMKGVGISEYGCSGV